MLREGEKHLGATKSRVPGLLMVGSGITGLWASREVNQLWNRAIDDHPSGPLLRELERGLASLNANRLTSSLNYLKWSYKIDDKYKLERQIEEEIDPYKFHIIGGRLLSIASAITTAFGAYKLLKRR